MRCVNCGYDNDENARFCQGCGSALVSGRDPLTVRMLQLLNDNIFMILCILHSVGTGMSFVGGGIPIVGVLMTVFLWMIFAKRGNGSLDSGHVRYISGTIYASYIVSWVLSGAMLLCGLLLLVLPFAVDMTELWNIVCSRTGLYMNDYLEGVGVFTDFILVVIAVIFIIAAIVTACFNVFGTRSIHRFVQSVYRSLECGQTNLAKCGTAQTWLMVFGVLDAVQAVLSMMGGNVISFLGGGCLAAVYVMGSILVRKYFDEFVGE